MVSPHVRWFLLAFLFCGFVCASPLYCQQALKSVAEPRTPGWLPAGSSVNNLVLDSGAACDLDQVLKNSSERVQKFVENVERFTATERLLQETIGKTGKISHADTHQFDYVVSIQEIRPGMLNVEEHRGGAKPNDFSGGVTGVITTGLPALLLIFHPNYSADFEMKCEGLANLDGKPAWQIYFRQRAEKPNHIRSYRLSSRSLLCPVPLEGRAWFASDSYEILSLHADLIGTLPAIELSVDRTAIEYGPVHFNRGEDLWLPKTAELYSDLRGKRIHQRVSFSDYLLFAVDDRQKISAPKDSPE
jgi:hypothetical protein